MQGVKTALLPPPTQEHLAIRDIVPPGIVLFTDGIAMCVVEVLPVDLTMSEVRDEERYARQFEEFLGSWDGGALMILVASFPQDCSSLLARLEESARWYQEQEELGYRRPGMGMRAREFLQALLKLTAELRPTSYRYFVGVFAASPLLRGGRGDGRGEDLDAVRKRALEQANRLMVRLEHHGFTARMLSDEELIGLFATYYHL